MGVMARVEIDCSCGMHVEGLREAVSTVEVEVGREFGSRKWSLLAVKGC